MRGESFGHVFKCVCRGFLAGFVKSGDWQVKRSTKLNPGFHNLQFLSCDGVVMILVFEGEHGFVVVFWQSNAVDQFAVFKVSLDQDVTANLASSLEQILIGVHTKLALVLIRPVTLNALCVKNRPN